MKQRLAEARLRLLRASPAFLETSPDRADLVAAYRSERPITAISSEIFCR